MLPNTTDERKYIIITMWYWQLLDADEEEEEKTSPIFKSKAKEKLMYKSLLLDPIEAL